MRASSLGGFRGLRGVVAGASVIVCSAVLSAQSGQPVQVVPVQVVPVTAAGSQTTPPVAVASQPITTPAAVTQAPAPAPALIQPLPSPQPAPQAPSVPSRKLDLTFSNGRVSLTADNVSVGEILAEWARKGGTVMDNADKLNAGMVSFVFENEPELKVLQALLRPYPGMIVIPRSPAAGPVAPSMSSFSRVNVVARSTASAAPFVGAPTTPMQQYQQPDEMPAMPPGLVPPPRVQQDPAAGAPPPPPSNMPSVGPSAARPGVVVAPVTPAGAAVPGQIIKK
jgi:hypothetical protein